LLCLGDELLFAALLTAHADVVEVSGGHEIKSGRVILSAKGGMEG
jgi:hypothetical protein